MLKVLVLQKYHELSDEEAAFQIMDRFSFLQFLGLQAGGDVPDARTIWDFKTHYGYKNHAKVDAKSKLVDGQATTAANVHDSQVFEELIDDSAHFSQSSDDYLIAKNCQNFILFKIGCEP